MTTEYTRSRFRFTKEMDLMLLREVLLCNPFVNKSNWRHIHDFFQEQIDNTLVPTSKVIRQHIQHLVRSRMREDRSNREFGYTELEQVLDEVIEMQEVTSGMQVVAVDHDYEQVVSDSSTHLKRRHSESPVYYEEIPAKRPTTVERDDEILSTLKNIEGLLYQIAESLSKRD